MKKILISAVILMASFSLFFCNEEPALNKDLNCRKILLGGCNGQNKSGQIVTGSDSLSIYLKKDTLHFFIGLNYTCCAPFDPKTEIYGDSVVIKIKDVCQNQQACYCKCMCYYTFDLSFTGFEDKKFYYKILVLDPRQSNPVIFADGWVEDGYDLQGCEGISFRPTYCKCIVYYTFDFQFTGFETGRYN